jgi:hypothetical protein
MAPASVEALRIVETLKLHRFNLEDILENKCDRLHSLKSLEIIVDNIDSIKYLPVVERDVQIKTLSSPPLQIYKVCS